MSVWHDDEYGCHRELPRNTSDQQFYVHMFGEVVEDQYYRADVIDCQPVIDSLAKKWGNSNTPYHCEDGEDVAWKCRFCGSGYGVEPMNAVVDEYINYCFECQSFECVERIEDNG